MHQIEFFQPPKSANGSVDNETNRKEAEQAAGASIELDEAGKESQITAMEDTNACTCERIDNFLEVQEAAMRKQEGNYKSLIGKIIGPPYLDIACVLGTNFFFF